MIQTVENGGSAAAMTISGLRQIQPDFRPNTIYVYLHDPEQTTAFVEEMSDSFGAKLSSVVNISELFDAQIGVYGDLFQVVAFMIVAATVLIIFLVLYLILKTAIIRGRRELGVQKALGFTTRQLMNQFSLQYMPAVALGILLGGVGGALGFNSIFVGLTQSLGIMNATLLVPVALAAEMCVALTLLAYSFALLICLRISRISAYMLISE